MLRLIARRSTLRLSAPKVEQIDVDMNQTELLSASDADAMVDSLTEYLLYQSAHVHHVDHDVGEFTLSLPNILLHCVFSGDERAVRQALEKID